MRIWNYLSSPQTQNAKNRMLQVPSHFRNATGENDWMT